MGFMEFYKKGQGSLGRVIALVSLVALVLWGGYRLWVTLMGSGSLSAAIFTVPHVGLVINLALLIAVAVALLGVAICVWVLNRPKLVDLLVDTESEMKKISWPSRQEAWNSSVIVVVTVVFMMTLLFAYDFLLNKILSILFTGRA